VFILGFIGVCEVFVYYCLQFYASSVTFYIDLLAFFSIVLCMLTSSDSHLNLRYLTSLFIFVASLLRQPDGKTMFAVNIFSTSYWIRMEEGPF